MKSKSRSPGGLRKAEGRGSELRRKEESRWGKRKQEELTSSLQQTEGMRRHRAQAMAISCLDNFPKVMLTPHVHLQFTLIDLPESEPLNSVS